jgi:hypothetical protein
MAIRRLGPRSQYQYICHVKRFADFVGRSVDEATTEDVRQYQLWLASACLISLRESRLPMMVLKPIELGHYDVAGRH